MKGQLTRDEDGDLWMYISPHHTGYWKFVDADDNWVDRGMALQVTGDAAALFEAAPQLLEALHASLDSLRWLTEWRTHDATACDQEIEHEIGRISKLIAKAESLTS